MGVHPHGLLTFGAFCNFCTEATGFSKTFPGITPHLATLSWFFKIPLLRDYLMAKGVSDHTRASGPFLSLKIYLLRSPIVTALQFKVCAPELNCLSLNVGSCHLLCDLGQIS